VPPARHPRNRPASRPGQPRRPRTPAPAPAPSTPAPPRRGPRLTGRTVVVVLTALVLVISYASSMRAWLQQRDDLAAARADIADSGDSIADLEQAKRRLQDPAYIEQQGRERFGWVLPGEVGYRVIGADGETLGSGARLDDRPTTAKPDPAWYDALWGSIEAAGEEAPPRKEEPSAEPPKVVKPDASTKQ